MLEEFKRRLGTQRNILWEIPVIIKDCLTNNLVEHFTVIAPTVLQINITSRCNSRCRMCNIWKNKEINDVPIDRIEAILDDKIFKSVEYLIISGGEPTLRKDLAEIIDIIISKMQKIKKISLPTNGLATRQIINITRLIAKSCNRHNIFLSLGVSLDGVGECYEKVRGISGGFARVVATLNGLKELKDEVGFVFGIGSTISSLNVRDIPQLIEISRKTNIDINFVIAALSDSYYKNSEQADLVNFSKDELEYLEGIFNELIKRNGVFNEMSYYYREVNRMLGGRKRNLPCLFSNQGLVLDSNGDMFYCINSRKIGNALGEAPSELYFKQENLNYRKCIEQEICQTCYASCFIGVGVKKLIFPFLFFLVREMLSKVMHKSSA